MRTRVSCWASFAVLGAMVCAAVLRADEQKIALNKVPQAVLAAIKGKFPKAELGKAARETEDGKTIFKITFAHKKHNYEAECLEDGTFEAINKEIERTELPDKVLATLNEKYPKARINLIEEVTKKDKLSCYEIELVSAAKEEIEVQIDPDGNVQKEENKGK